MTDAEQKSFAQGRAAGLAEIIDMLDKFGTLKYRAGCSTVKTSQELLEQAHAYRHMIHEALANLSPIPSDAGKDDARDAARYQLLRRGQKWSVIDGIGDTLRADELDAAIDAALSSLEVIGKGEKG